MIDNIKLAASFSHNDKSNIFSNILVSGGMATVQNDMVGISLEVDSDLDFCCNAKQLVSMLNNCDPEKMKMTIKNNKLYVSSGRFKSNIAIVDKNNYPDIALPESKIPIQHDIINIMGGVSQFTDPNDVRLALRGVELSSDSVNATNGHVAVKRTIDINDIDPVVIPTKSIISMAKVNAHIDSISMSNNIAYFQFNDGFMFTRLIDQKMPDVGKVLSDIKEKTELSLIADAVKSIWSMCDVDKTIILSNEIKTRSGDASIDGFNFKECAFNADYLLKIIEIADSIDLSPYPKACPFEGDNIKGAVIGVIL